MEKDFRPQGIVVALATPLQEGERVDENGLRRLVNHVLAGRVHGLVVSGTQGEFYGLNLEEKRRALEIVVDEIRGRVPVYAGTGSPTTRESVVLSRMAEEVGADAILVMTPYFISPSEDELYRHHSAVAAATQLPVVLYTNPMRTGVDLAPTLAARLSQIDNIVGIKDSSGDLAQTMEYIRLCGRGFSVLAGRDTLIYATLQCGGQGAISGTANVVPGLVVEIYEAFVAGDGEKALAAQRRLTPLRLAFDLGTFPVATKEALALMGICSARSFAPVGPLAEKQREELRAILKALQVV